MPRIRFALSSLGVFSCCTIGLAQQHIDTTNRMINEVVVTAQLEPTSLKNSVYKVRTINQEQILRRSTATITTLLNTELGIRFSNDMALGESDTELMGMKGQNIKILLNGVPLLDRGATRNSLTQIDVNNIERIEIIEGPLSVVYGTDALAGVINIITKQSLGDGIWNLHASLLEETANQEYSPFFNEGNHNFNLGVSHQFKNWNFMVNGSRNEFGGWKGENEGRALAWQPKTQYLGGARVGFSNDFHITSFTFDYANEDIFTPGNYNARNYIDKNYITNRYTNTLQSDWKFSDKWTANGSLSYQNLERNTVTKRTDLATGETELTTGAGEQDVAKFDNLFFRGTAQYKWSDIVHLQGGVEYDRESGMGDRLKENSSLTEYAVFVTSEIRPLPWMNVRPGLRFLANDVFDAPPVIPSLNMKFGLDEKFDLRAAYARGFRSPALRELFFTFFDSNHSIQGNENLKPEHSNSFNAYLSYTDRISETSNFDASLGGFYNEFDNMITLGIDANNPTVNTYINVERFKTTGIVWDNRYQYKAWTATLGLSYIGRYNTYYTDDNTQKQFLWSPEINSNIFYDINPWGTQLNLFYKFYGKRPTFEISDEAEGEQTYNQVFVGSFHQADFTVNQKITKQFSLDAGVRNLFNTINVVNTGTVGESAHDSAQSSIPMSYGRSFFVGLKFNMNK